MIYILVIALNSNPYNSYTTSSQRDRSNPSRKRTQTHDPPHSRPTRTQPHRIPRRSRRRRRGRRRTRTPLRNNILQRPRRLSGGRKRSRRMPREIPNPDMVPREHIIIIQSAIPQKQRNIEGRPGRRARHGPVLVERVATIQTAILPREHERGRRREQVEVVAVRYVPDWRRGRHVLRYRRIRDGEQRRCVAVWRWRGAGQRQACYEPVQAGYTGAVLGPVEVDHEEER